MKRCPPFGNSKHVISVKHLAFMVSNVILFEYDSMSIGGMTVDEEEEKKKKRKLKQKRNEIKSNRQFCRLHFEFELI